MSNILKTWAKDSLVNYFDSFFPGLSSASSLWLLPFLGVMQGRAYVASGVRRSHFVQVLLFALVVSGCDGGRVSASRFSSISVIFFGVSKHFARMTLLCLLEAKYIEIVQRGGRGRGQARAVYYGWTELGLKKWNLLFKLFQSRLVERAAVLREMEQAGKPIRFDAL